MPENKPPSPGRYIDPLVDFAFKKIFGSEPNKDLLIAFLNEVFRGSKVIADLTYDKNEHPGELKDEGAAIFDLHCTGQHGEKFLIEVQRGRQGNFKERALFYTSRVISGLAPKGKREEWAYNLSEVYLVALLEDFTLAIDDSPKYLHDICLCNRDTGKVFYDKLGYIYLELNKFVKEEAELQTGLDKWLYVLKNMSRMDKLPIYLRKSIFEKLFNIAEYTNLTKEERNMYDSSQKYRWDNKNVLDYAVNTAVSEAEHKNTIKIATEFKKLGVPPADIAKATGLSIQEIEKL